MIKPRHLPERNLSDMKGILKKARKRIKAGVRLSPLKLTSSCSIVADVRRLSSCRQSGGKKLWTGCVMGNTLR